MSIRIKPVRHSKKGQKLKTKTDEQVKTLKNFFEKHVSKEWSASEV